MFEKIKFIMGPVWDFLAPLIRQLMSAIGPILANAAMTAVTAVEVSMQQSGGEAKRAEAFECIKADLASQGISLAASLINAAIEAAVVKLVSK